MCDVIDDRVIVSPCVFENLSVSEKNSLFFLKKEGERNFRENKGGYYYRASVASSSSSTTKN